MREILLLVLGCVMFAVRDRAHAALPGQEQIDACAATWCTRAEWDARAASLKKQILGTLAPWPAQTALKPIWREKIVHDTYTVQPVAFESMPGFYCCANLYLPTKFNGKLPAVIRSHGHGKNGRYGNQEHCAAMARMGAAVLSISMV